MRHEDEDLSVYQPWIEQACAALGVDPAEVDVESLLALAGHLARRAGRPMAPVGSFILGAAFGAGGSLDQLTARLLQTLPAEPEA